MSKLNANAMLGLPEESALLHALLAAVRAAGEDGVTARDLHKRHPAVDLASWYDVCAAANKQGLVVAGWRAVPGTTTAACQEAVYRLPAGRETPGIGKRG